MEIQIRDNKKDIVLAMVIKDDNGDSDAITKWFYSSESSNGTKYSRIQTTIIMANDSALIMKFPSGFYLMILYTI